MLNQAPPTSSIFPGALGDFRWVRAHVSIFAVGAVLLVIINTLIGGSSLWSLTSIGIWSMLIIVHLVLLAIARLSTELLADDEENTQPMPTRDAFVMDPQTNSTESWGRTDQSASTSGNASPNPETVSWQIATDVAQAKRQSNDSESEST